MFFSPVLIRTRRRFSKFLVPLDVTHSFPSSPIPIPVPHLPSQSRLYVVYLLLLTLVQWPALLPGRNDLEHAVRVAHGPNILDLAIDDLEDADSGVLKPAMGRPVFAKVAGVRRRPVHARDAAVAVDVHLVNALVEVRKGGLDLAHVSLKAVAVGGAVFERPAERDRGGDQFVDGAEVEFVPDVVVEAPDDQFHRLARGGRCCRHVCFCTGGRNGKPGSRCVGGWSEVVKCWTVSGQGGFAAK